MKLLIISTERITSMKKILDKNSPVLAIRPITILDWCCMVEKIWIKFLNIRIKLSFHEKILDQDHDSSLATPYANIEIALKGKDTLDRALD